MFRSLSTGAIGVAVPDLEAGLDLAARHGFQGYHFSIAEAADLGVARVVDVAKSKGVRLAAWGFPLDFRGDEASFDQSLAALPRLAAVASELEVRRTSTWIMPCSDELDFEANFTFHASRLKPAATVLADYGIRLGLEYVAPRTSWTGGAYAFVHTMEQMGRLCEAIGPNAGFLLDSWHWYTAGEGEADLRQLSPEQVVDVHVNDAPRLPRDEQLDHIRALPGETGVIDIAVFLRSLADIGYDGPVMVEPFSEALREMGSDDACAATSSALLQVWTSAGL